MKIHYTTYLLIIISLFLGIIDKFLILFFSVIFHELCHVLQAKLQKRKIKKIVIFPIGGIFEIENDENVSLWSEFLIVISGPIGSLLLMQVPALSEANKMILMFNLIPVFPLDGGKILEIILFKFLRFKLSIKIILIYSTVFSVGLLGYYLYLGNFNQILIFLFVIASNINSYKNISMRFLKFINDKLSKPKKLKINKIKVKSSSYFKKGYNNIYIDKNEILDERNIIACN